MAEEATKTKPFRYFDNSNASKHVGKSELVLLRMEHGVLMVHILVNSLMHEKVLADIYRQIQGELGRATKGVLIDCQRVSLPASSEFLGKLMLLRQELKPRGIPLAVSGLNGPLKQAFDLVKFARVIQTFDTPLEAVAVMGEFTDWERVGMASVAQKKIELRQHKSSEVDLSKYLNARVLGVGAGVIVSLLFLGLLINWIFMRTPAVGNTAGDSYWQNAPTATITGQVQYASRGVALGDGASVILVWPAGVVPDPKHNLAENYLFGELNEIPSLTPRGPFIAKVQPDGAFSLNVPVPQASCDYHILIASANDVNKPLAETDRNVLRMYFADPDKMLGSHALHLARNSLAPSETLTVNWTFGKSME